MDLVFISNAEQFNDGERRHVFCGTEVQMEDLAERFRKAYFYSPLVERPFRGYTFGPRVEVRPLCRGMHTSNSNLPRFVRRYVRGVRRALREHGRDAVYVAYVPDAYIGVIAMREFKRAGVKAFYRVTNDLVSEFVERRPSAVRRLVAATAGRAYNALQRRLMHGETCFFTGALRWGEEPAWYPVDSTSIRRRDLHHREPREDAPLDVYFLGRFDPMKGLRYFLDAAALARDGFRFHVVGGGTPEEDEEARRHADAVAPGRVTFHGRVPFGDALFAHLKRADIVVVPSVQEYQGKVAIEAMAVGSAVVASRVGGIPKIVRHLENGILVPPRDPRAIVDWLHRLAKDVELRRALAEGGYRSAERLTVEALNDFIVQKIVEHGVVPAADGSS